MDGKNIVSQKFMNDKAIFADLFNFLYHNGERVVKSEELFPLSEISEYEITSNEIKLISVMSNKKEIFAVFEVNNQPQIYSASIHYLLMEMVNYYIAQIEKTAGFQKGDKLYPVVPAVIYWKPDKWDGAKSFDEIFDVSNKAYRKSIPQYDLKLVSSYDLKDEDFSKFHTELGIVLEFIKYSGDKSTLKELVQSEPKYKNLSTNAAEMLRVFGDM